MAKSQFKCTRCKRTFGMAAHLARHLSAIHGVGGAPRTPSALPKRGPGRPPLRRNVTATQMSSVGSSIVNDMHKFLSDLTAQRETINSQIDAIEAAMSALSGETGPAVRRGPGRPPGRPPGQKTGRPPGRPPGRKTGHRGRAGSLKDMIFKVLSQRKSAMSPNDISRAVTKAGYSTKAKDLTKAVSNMLPDVPGVKRLAFGSYALTGKGE